MAWAGICNPCSFPSFLSSLRNDEQRQRPQADRSAGAPGRSPQCQGLVRKIAATETWLWPGHHARAAGQCQRCQQAHPQETSSVGW